MSSRRLSRLHCVLVGGVRPDAPLGYRRVFPKRITVLGLGLLGGSLCQALRQRRQPSPEASPAPAGLSRTPVAPTVVGYAHRQSTLLRAIEMRLADDLTLDLPRAVAGADLVVLCSPIGTFADVFRTMAPHLAPGCIVTDVASTKQTACRLARELLPKGVRFVGSHPMAGGEKAGSANARPDLFEGAVVVVTPESDSDPDAVNTVVGLWSRLGSRVTRLDPADHDRLVAKVSHLPHVAASMLVALQTPESLGLAGSGFRDTTRVASGDADLWREILTDNRQNVVEALEALADESRELARLLKAPDDGAALRAYLAAAAARRDALLRDRPENA